MKKLVLSLFMLAGIGTSSYAQGIIGPKVGMSFATATDTKVPANTSTQDYKTIITPQLGIVFNARLGDYVSLRPELLYSQRGFKGAGRFMGSDYDLSRTSGYLDVPLFLSFKPLEGISVLFGPQYSFLLHQHDAFSNSSLTIDQEQAFKNDNIKKHILCLAGGIDFNLANIVLGLRTGWDLTHNKDDGTGEIPRYKNIWLQGTVGFRAY